MLRVALIHDWLTGMRGGEKALEVFCEMFPAADLFTLVYLPGTTSPTIERRSVKRSAIQWLPMAGKLYRQYLPLFPIAVEQFDLDGYDLVISTSHCAAKSVVVTGRARHLCYCLTPMRYAWDQFDAYFGIDRVGQTRQPGVTAGAGGSGAVGSRHGRPCAPLSRYLSVCCAEDRAVL